jgi:D-sedoheptulose 7-phosphate isomerase
LPSFFEKLMDKTFAKLALEEAKSTLELFLADNVQMDTFQKAIECLATAYKNGNKAFSCGNGGSMCDAMHFAEELTGRFRKERRPLPAMAVSDPSHISCVANDYGYNFIFSKSIEAWGTEGDVLLAISTSGNSPNIIEAVKVAKQKKMKVIGLLGKGGGQMASMVDFPIIVPASSSDRIQEIHIKIIHTFIEGIERNLFPENYA